MADEIELTLGQCSETGPKEENEDFFGVLVPGAHVQKTKGAVALVADGMSGSGAGREAAESAVKGFLTDYFATPESWTVKTSAARVLSALNRWLYGRAHLQGSSAAFGTTFSAVVIKSGTAHVLHVGDSRIYRWKRGDWELLTRDHRVNLGHQREFLNRALGMEPHLEVDYSSVPVETGDVFVLTTDGVHGSLSDEEIGKLVGMARTDLNETAKAVVQAALRAGSTDNSTCQIVRVDSLPVDEPDAFYQKLTALPFPPDLEPDMILDGYRILKELHASKRSQLYLATDGESGDKVAIKTPSVNFDDDAQYIEQFIHEDWVGRRVRSPNLVRACGAKRNRRFLYSVQEYIDGETLRSWMVRNPRPELDVVVNIVEQLAQGLRSLHRLEMLHRDLKPENAMIDAKGQVKIVDFGSVKIAGVAEIASPLAHHHLVGTLDYAAPEYHRGDSGSRQSDLYSLGLIAYELLTGHLPYKKPPEKTRGCRIDYVSALHHNPRVPLWVDGALQRATACDPRERYDTLSEFVYDLGHPNSRFESRAPLPLIERNPVRLWQGIAAAMLVWNLLMLYFLTGG
ncbi:MAG: bifunctional protein-serine/threonine kinase/phosphatase [Chromatiales bacterium]|nr:bifunctional protein-serine/threonine kinase/phosphatase [Chromatiales bacterium]